MNYIILGGAGFIVKRGMKLMRYQLACIAFIASSWVRA